MEPDRNKPTDINVMVDLEEDLIVGQSLPGNCYIIWYFSCTVFDQRKTFASRENWKHGSKTLIIDR